MFRQSITNLEDINRLEHAWTDLVDQQPFCHVGLTPQWVRAWWKSFETQRSKLSVQSWWDGSELLAVAPVIEHHTTLRKIPLTQLASMVNDQSPVWDIPHLASLGAEEIIEVLTDLLHSTNAPMVSLKRVPANSRICEIAERSKYEDMLVTWKSGATTPVIDTTSDWHEFYGGLSSKFRKNLRKKLREFAKIENSTVEWRYLRSLEDPLFEEIVATSGRSWKAERKRDLVSSIPARRFLANIVAEFGDKNLIRVYFARIGGQMAAFEFHVEYAGKTYPIRADFDETFRRFSPGSVVEYHAIQECFLRPEIQVYDSCANDYWYLKNWTNENRCHRTIYLFPRKQQGRLLYELEHRAVPLAKKVVGMRQ